MAFTQERRGEISEALLWVILMEKGITLRPKEMRMRAVKLSKKTKIPLNDILVFMEELIARAITEAFEV